MKKTFLYTLRSKIIFYIVVPFLFLMSMSGVFQVYGIPFTEYKGTLNKEKQAVFNKLNALADLKKKELQNWIQERIKNIDIIASNEMIGVSLLNLQNEIAKRSENNRDDKKLWSEIINLGISKRLNNTLELITKTYGYYESISIIDSATLTTILSSNEKNIGFSNDDDTNIDILRFLKNSSKVSVFFKRNKSGTHTDMIIYHSIGKNPSDSTYKKFIISANVEFQEFVEPMLHIEANLGKTIEVVLVNEKAQNLTGLKFDIPDGTKPKILEYTIKATPAQLASKGNQGIIESKDYQEIPVLAAYRHISIAPGTGIGLVVKENKAETLDYIKHRVIMAVLINIIAMSILLLIGAFIVRKITHPIRILIKVAEKAQRGSYEERVPVTSNDEIGTLSEQFNLMLDKIETSQTTLEGEVAKRTAELSKTNEKLLDEIKKHHETMDSLREKEGHLQSIMDYSPQIIYLKDLEGKYILVNKKFRELPRLAGKANVIGTKASDYMPPDVADEIENAEKEILKTGKIFKRETESRAPDSKKWFSTVKFPLRDSSGKIYGICGFIEDITERKNSETLIKESESQLRAIINNSPALIFIKDIEGKYMMINSEYEKNFNISQSEISGKTDFEIFPEEIAKKISENDRKVIKENKAIKEEEVVKQDDGNHTYISVKFPLLNSTGNIYAVCGIATDITEAKTKKMELYKLGTAIAQTEECIVITDVNAMIEYVNPAFEKITGYPADEAIRQNPSILKSGEQDSKFYDNLWNTLTSGNTWSGEFTNKRKDGSIYYEEATISPVFDTNGKIINYVAVKKDISQDKSKEEQLLQAQKMESVGRLAGGVAHDFNNILVGILGYSELIIDSVQNDIQLRKYAEEIRGAGERAASLTKQLLAFSRKQVIEPKIIDINKLIENLKNMLSRIIGENIEIALKLKESGLGTTKADPDQIAQVLLNLAVNARDAMGKGGKIIIKTSNVELDKKYLKEDAEVISGKYILISVADTGKGMDRETQKKIFEPFFTTKEIGQGTGLGLSTVYGIVKQSNGYISVYSEPGRGTAFKIYLPRVDTKEITYEDELPDKSALVSKQERILIVEDEETVRELAFEIVSSKGYDALLASSAEEAIKMTGNGIGHIDLLLTDLVMPGMDGVELSEKMKDIIPSLKVLIMSGYSDKEFLRNGGLKEHIPYIQKPFAPTKLLRKIRTVLDEG